jgi:O-antigen/teichoic acid export membrane protein
LSRLEANIVGWLQQRQHPLVQAGAEWVLRLQGAVRSSAFSRNVSKMLIGTVLGQALSVMLAPALTRIYSPADFGTLGVYMSMLNILVGLAAFRYEIPMLAAATEEAATNMLALCMGLLVVTTLLLSLTALLLPQSLLIGIGLGKLTWVRVLLPMGFACLGGYYVMSYYATRENDFDSLARTRISQGVIGPLSQIAFGLLGGGVVGLTMGFIIGQSSGTLLLFKRLVLNRLSDLRRISLRGVRREAWTHRAFPMISSWANLIDTAGAGQLVYLLVAIYYPGSVAGYMFIAERVVARPLLMVSTSLLTVFMGEIGHALSTEPWLLRRRFLQVSSRQLMFGAAWIVTAGVAAELAFPLIFGRDWADATPYLLVLSVVYLANSVIGSVNYTLQVLGKQAIAAVWQVSRVTAVVLGFVTSSSRALDALHAIAIYAVIQVVACSILFMMMKFSVDRLPQAAPAPCV